MKIASILLILLVVLAAFKVISSRLQDYLIVKNQSGQPIAKLRVVFHDHTVKKSVIFQNVPSNSEQWQPFNQRWGMRDSGRDISVEGMTADGKKVRAKLQGVNEFYGFVGERFIVIVQPDGSAKLECCH